MLLITASRRGSSAAGVAVVVVVGVLVVVLGWLRGGRGGRSDDDLADLEKLKKKPFLSLSSWRGRWPWLDLRRLRSGCCGRAVVELSPGWVMDEVMGGKGTGSWRGCCCCCCCCCSSAMCWGFLGVVEALVLALVLVLVWGRTGVLAADEWFV